MHNKTITDFSSLLHCGLLQSTSPGIISFCGDWRGANKEEVVARPASIATWACTITGESCHVMPRGPLP